MVMVDQSSHADLDRMRSEEVEKTVSSRNYHKLLYPCYFRIQYYCSIFLIIRDN
jgi:hypothetical protein